MKACIRADMEGITGVTRHEQVMRGEYSPAGCGAVLLSLRECGQGRAFNPAAVTPWAGNG